MGQFEILELLQDKKWRTSKQVAKELGTTMNTATVGLMKLYRFKLLKRREVKMEKTPWHTYEYQKEDK